MILAAIAALGSLATQLIVPALPQIARDLHAGADDAQLVIGVYLAGLGLGQLFAGPMADRIGRKPVLVTGLVLFSLASLAAALAPSLPALLAARLVQALGGAAGVVTSRVLVGDLFPPEEAAAKQATLMAVVLISPALAPVLGGLLSETAGWRTAFVLLALGGIGGVLFSARALPESSRHAAADTPGLVTGLRRLAGNRNFLGPALTIMGGTAGLYMFLGTAPFLLEHTHGLRPRDVGLCLMLVASASIAGTFLVAPLERRGDALLAGTLLVGAGALTLLLLALAGFGSLAAFLGPATLFGLGAGISGPAGISRIIAAERGLAGTAASLAGAGQMLVSALAAALLGRFAPVDAQSLGIGMVACSALALAAALMFRQARV